MVLGGNLLASLFDVLRPDRVQRARLPEPYGEAEVMGVLAQESRMLARGGDAPDVRLDPFTEEGNSSLPPPLCYGVASQLGLCANRFRRGPRLGHRNLAEF